MIQLPPSLKDAHKQLGKLLKQISKYNPGSRWKICVEFRNKSWYTDDTYTLLNNQNIAIVIHDMPASATPALDITTDFTYLRFHGTERGYKGSYTNDFLHTESKKINGWQKAGKTVYIYFNNTIGNAAGNLLTLGNYLK